jgi:hypothetical protein
MAEERGGGNVALTNQIVLAIFVVYGSWSDAEKPGCAALVALGGTKSGL